jgi:hypothetical protein
MSKLHTIPAETLQQMRAAGLSDRQIENYLLSEDLRSEALRQPRATVAVAMRALSGAGAPHSLVRAYVEAGARPSRIMRDLVAAVGRDCRLSAAASCLMHKRIDPRPTVASIWAQIHAAAAGVQQ